MRKEHNIEDMYAPSPVQEGMLFYTLSTPTSGMYLNQYCFEIKGPLDRAAFVQAWESLVARHAILRTAFIWEKREKAFQLVFKRLHLPFKEYDWQQYNEDMQRELLQQLLQEDIGQDFDLARPPLMRLKLIALAEEHFYFIWTSHHLVLDGWSRAIVVKELMAAYSMYQRGKTVTLSPAPRYRAYINWLEQAVSEAEEAKAYWQEALKGIVAPTQLIDTTGRRAQRSTQSAETRELLLSARFTTQLQALARQQKTTLNILLLAAWALVLNTYSQERHVVFGVTTAGRPYDLANVEEMVGLFINTLPLHLEILPSMSLPAWIQQVQRRQSELLQYQHVPASRIHEWSSIPRELPLFESSFVFFNYPLDLDLQQIRLGDEITLHLQNHRGVELSHLPLVMMAHPGERHEHLVLRLAYETTSFSSEQIVRMLGQVSYFLEQMVMAPEQRLGQFSLLTAEERKLLAQWNSTDTNEISDACWVQQFALQVERQPDALAVVEEGRQITYQALDQRSGALCAVLRCSGVGSESIVALLMERGIDFISALIAVFKAGGAALPLDTRYPLARQTRLIAQSGARLALCSASLVVSLRASLIQQEEAPVQLLAYEELDLHSSGSSVVPSYPPLAHTLAYIMFTSGSTGQPKGAMVEQEGMLNHMWGKLLDLHITRNDRIAQNGPISFDIVIWQCLAALLVGGSVCVLNDEIVADPPRLCSILEREGVTILQIVPSLLRLLLQTSGRARFSALRWLVPTGEALPGDLAESWLQRYPSIPLLNTYGSTECSDDQCHYVVESAMKWDTLFPIVPIGYPIRNMQAYILNQQLEPLPIGVIGDLYIGGEGVGRGYLKQLDATSERFLPDPFHGQAGRRMYKTGDLARYLEDGRIEFLRRADQQVKIQGFRVELGEIESVLATHPSVQVCAVAVQAVADSNQHLIAYIVPHSTVEPGDDGKKKGTISSFVEQQVTEWQKIYDERYERRQISPLDPLTHFATWISSYTRQPFSQEEVHACIQDASRSILALQPRRVLEIGCGSGLIARQLIAYCEHYTGLDIAEHGLLSLREYLETIPERHASITLLQRAAHEVSDFAPESFDVIVLNEVVQYFPHISYLYQVLERIVPLLASGGTIFLGDIRSLPHLRLFHTSVCLQQADENMLLRDLRQQIDKNIAREKELLIAPDFFLTLQQYLPHISAVSLQYKFGEYDNEFTCFRYNVMLRIERSGEPEKRIEGGRVYDWQQENISPDAVQHLLQREPADSVLLTHIPNGRLQGYQRELEFLSLLDEQQSVKELRTQMQQSVHMLQGVHPDQLLVIGDTLGYITEVLWEPERTTTFSVRYTRADAPAGAYPYGHQLALQGANSPFSARFERLLAQEVRNEGPTLAELPQGPVWSDYANNPLLYALGERLIPRLRQFLQEKLPAYMVPTHFMLLDALPLSSNGKLDRRRLPLPDMSRPETGERYVPPQTNVEQLVAQIWQHVLGVNRVGLHDNFFSLGGHSLLATQILSRLRSTFRMDLSLRDLFHRPTVTGVVQLLQEQEPQPGHIVKIMLAFERFQQLTEQEKHALSKQRRNK